MHALHCLEHLADFYALLLAKTIDFLAELFFVILKNLKAFNGLVLALGELLCVLLLELGEEGRELARAAVLLDLGDQRDVLLEGHLVQFELLRAALAGILSIHFLGD